MRADSRGDSPTRGAASSVSTPSMYGRAWRNITCPACGERIKTPVCVLAGVTPMTHRNRHSDARPFCALVVVVGRDYAEPRVVVVNAPAQSIEDVMQHEVERLLVERAA